MHRLGVDPAVAANTDRLLGRLAEALTLARLVAPRGIFSAPAELEILADELYLNIANAVDARLSAGLELPEGI